MFDAEKVFWDLSPRWRHLTANTIYDCQDQKQNSVISDLLPLRLLETLLLTAFPFSFISLLFAVPLLIYDAHSIITGHFIVPKAKPWGLHLLFVYKSFLFNFHFSKLRVFLHNTMCLLVFFFFNLSCWTITVTSYFVSKSKSNLCLHCQDAQIEKEKQDYNVTGGCTALTIVYLLGKLYVANAGDSRCVGSPRFLSARGLKIGIPIE